MEGILQEIRKRNSGEELRVAKIQAARFRHGQKEIGISKAFFPKDQLPALTRVRYDLPKKQVVPISLRLDDLIVPRTIGYRRNGDIQWCEYVGYVVGRLERGNIVPLKKGERGAILYLKLRPLGESTIILRNFHKPTQWFERRLVGPA